MSRECSLGKFTVEIDALEEKLFLAVNGVLGFSAHFRTFQMRLAETPSDWLGECSG